MVKFFLNIPDTIQVRLAENALLDFVSTHRIAASRVIGAAFLVLVLVTESANEGTPLAAVLFLVGLVLVGIATIGRLWCSLYISGYKNSALVTIGPYSVCRNPLYFFSILGFAGVGFATETVTLAVALVGLAVAFYPAVIAREEAVLRSRFPREFEVYSARVPKLLPQWSKLCEPKQYTVNPVLFRRTMGDVIWFVALVGILELVEALHELKVVEALIHLH